MRDLTILVPEPDSYKDIVLFFDSCLKNTWPDCPYSIYWMNEKETIDSPRIKAINCGDGNPLAFCGRLLDGIHFAGTRWILLWCSDFLPTKRINTGDIEIVLNYMEQNDINYCNLKKVPKLRMKQDKTSPHFYKEDENSAYNISIGFCIFKAVYLEDMIQDRNWTGWQLENHGMMLSSEGRNFACAYYDKNIGNTLHLVSQGRLIQSTVKKLHKYGIDTSLLHRSLLPKIEENRRKVRTVCGYICPTRLRKYVKMIMGKLGVKYGSRY